MKITNTERYHNATLVTECTFQVDDVAPIPATIYGVRELQPRTVTVRIENGEVIVVRAEGPSIIKAGFGSNRHRAFYSYEREKWPWLAELIGLAQDTYSAKHKANHCNGDVVAEYAEDGDMVNLNCQACAWYGWISPDAGHTRIEMRHEAVRST